MKTYTGYWRGADRCTFVNWSLQSLVSRGQKTGSSLVTGKEDRERVNSEKVSEVPRRRGRHSLKRVVFATETGPRTVTRDVRAICSLLPTLLLNLLLEEVREARAQP